MAEITDESGNLLWTSTTKGHGSPLQFRDKLELRVIVMLFDLAVRVRQRCFLFDSVVSMAASWAVWPSGWF